MSKRIILEAVRPTPDASEAVLRVWWESEDGKEELVGDAPLRYGGRVYLEWPTHLEPLQLVTQEGSLIYEGRTQ